MSGGVVLHATDERDAFHAAIWKTPDDDLPRLVYADWLDERGEHDAAAFLRLLCAVRTCPSDVDKLRPLVADFRRAMAKLSAKWVEDVCPVPPAVVVGPWVDVDHEANAKVLDFIRNRRRERTGLRPAGDTIPVRPDQEVRWPSQEVVDRLWGELQPALSAAAACAIDGVPALVDVWSGVVMAVAVGEGSYAVRAPRSEAERVPAIFRVRVWAENDANWVRNANTLGSGWIVGDEDGVEQAILQRAAAEFDPASRPG